MGIIFDKPLIGVVMCQINKDGHPTQTVHNKYFDAVIQAGGVPLALPHGLVVSSELLDHAMAVLDGVLLTGSTSNIEPWHYGEEGKEQHADPGRDRLAFSVLTKAIGKKMPILAICRGLQELVVITGGSLWRQLALQPGFLTHHEDATQPLAQQYAPAHEVFVTPDGLLSRLLNGCERLWVNSLHQQGIRALGSHLEIEARAADGLIEAVSLRNHPFVLAVQWHPEWQAAQNTASRQLFEGFIHASFCYHKETRT